MDELMKGPDGEQFFKSLIDYAESKDPNTSINLNSEQFSGFAFQFKERESLRLA